MSEAYEKMQKIAGEVLRLSHSTLLVNLRFLDMALAELVPESVPLGTMYTDGKTLYYNPVFVLKQYADERYVITRDYLHILLHCLYRHNFVNELLNEAVWDLACDITVENIINELDIDSLYAKRSSAQQRTIYELKSKLKLLTAEKIYRYYLDKHISDDEIGLGYILMISFFLWMSYIGEFFAVSAFGTMSGKGFGCFSVKEKPMNRSEIAAALKQNYGARDCYVFYGGNKPFKQIKTLYSLMKSGINFNGYQRSLLFLYMHEECEIDNEKAWMKQTGIMPIVNNSGKYVKEKIGTKPRYVRALLGTSDGYKVMDENRRKLSLEIEGGEIERCPSPILFRIFDRNVYMVANRIPTKIYGKTFGFKCKREGEISVPELSEIGGESFIDDFLEYAVGRITTEENIKQFFRFQITIEKL